MKTKAEATIEDLYRVPGKAEIINGEIVRMPLTGALPARARMQIGLSLHEYERQVGGGFAVLGHVGFIVDLPNRKSFSPDAGFHIGERTMKFAEGAPIFAVEVRNENDYGPAAEKQIAAKRTDYFAAGTSVVWDVDLLGEDVVRVYRASGPGRATIYRRGEVAEAEPALPGWTMPVDDLFL